MSGRKWIGFVAAGALLAGAAVAKEAGGVSGPIEQRLERIERAIERLEAKVTGGDRSGREEGCPMMGGGMMGGGMMGDGTKGNTPNAQWDREKRAR